ncbi:XrtB/PEP-CTERM-associated transcriptional regulator EpsA [Massilia sp. S19_KUP03_FR1]|uniref:XrtB/PEP-CTERM-associated transcriptional regulator EpsA n=1 Tax=Massilia sp. S19_KUP03_FR1 TaxID=3025503 RepID=UPI002FCCF671
MDQAVILSPREQEYLLRVIEAGVAVRAAHEFFLWTQGQLQALLPHQALVCLQFDGDQLVRLHCVHTMVLAPQVLAALEDRAGGLALRIARHCRAAQRLPVMLDIGVRETSALAPFQEESRRLGFDNVLVHGSGAVAGGATMFALFGMPQRPGARHAWFFELVLPHLHLALLRLSGLVERAPTRAPVEAARPLSARETEILHWLAQGKSNFEIGCILGISGATVKNHLQRIYRALGVSNRAHALARGSALRLLELR